MVGMVRVVRVRRVPMWVVRVRVVIVHWHRVVRVRRVRVRRVPMWLVGVRVVRVRGVVVRVVCVRRVGVASFSV